MGSPTVSSHIKSIPHVGRISLGTFLGSPYLWVGLKGSMGKIGRRTQGEGTADKDSGGGDWFAFTFGLPFFRIITSSFLPR